MIKGCTKRVVVVKDVQSDIFEASYFILRPRSEKSKTKARETDIISEANRLVIGKSDFNGSHCVTLEKSGKGKRRVRDILFFVLGAALSFAGCLAVTVVGV